MRTVIAGALVVLTLALAAAAGEKTLPPASEHARLTPGPGSEVAQRQCQFCHSTDYIVMQPRVDAAAVTKMVKVYGAPLSDAEVKIIAEYLATAYGPPK